jgi:uroporphyrinogen decarboxylase
MPSGHDVRSLGVPYALHVCGNTKAILADLVTTGADALGLDYKTDVRLAHDLMTDCAVFIGNLDPSAVVAPGTPALVEAKSRELIALFGDPPLHPERRLRHPRHGA